MQDKARSVRPVLPFLPLSSPLLTIGMNHRKAQVQAQPSVLRPRLQNQPPQQASSQNADRHIVPVQFHAKEGKQMSSTASIQYSTPHLRRSTLSNPR